MSDGHHHGPTHQLVPLSRLAMAFGVTVERVEQAVAMTGHLYREYAMPRTEGHRLGGSPSPETRDDAGERLRVQWWLAELSEHGNPTLIDGAHSHRQGAERALYLYQRMGFSGQRRYAVAEVRLTEAKPDAAGVNEEALSTFNAIGLRP